MQPHGLRRDAEPAAAGLLSRRLLLPEGRTISQPPLLDILRLGAYQILFLDKVPDSAAVNEAVELAKDDPAGARQPVW